MEGQGRKSENPIKLAYWLSIPGHLWDQNPGRHSWTRTAELEITLNNVYSLFPLNFLMRETEAPREKSGNSNVIQNCFQGLGSSDGLNKKQARMEKQMPKRTHFLTMVIKIKKKKKRQNVRETFLCTCEYAE